MVSEQVAHFLEIERKRVPLENVILILRVMFNDFDGESVITILYSWCLTGVAYQRL